MRRRRLGDTAMVALRLVATRIIMAFFALPGLLRSRRLGSLGLGRRLSVATIAVAVSPIVTLIIISLTVIVAVTVAIVTVAVITVAVITVTVAVAIIIAITIVSIHDSSGCTRGQNDQERIARHVIFV
jgi:hypothetical protein